MRTWGHWACTEPVSANPLNFRSSCPFHAFKFTQLDFCRNIHQYVYKVKVLHYDILEPCFLQPLSNVLAQNVLESVPFHEKVRRHQDRNSSSFGWAGSCHPMSVELEEGAWDELISSGLSWYVKAIPRPMWKRCLSFIDIESWFGACRTVNDEVPLWSVGKKPVNSMCLSKSLSCGKKAPDTNNTKKIGVRVLEWITGKTLPRE